jgi:hypothetical protein
VGWGGGGRGATSREGNSRLCKKSRSKGVVELVSVCGVLVLRPKYFLAGCAAVAFSFHAAVAGRSRQFLGRDKHAVNSRDKISSFLIYSALG